MIGIKDGGQVTWLTVDDLLMGVLASMPPDVVGQVIGAALNAAKQTQRRVIEIGRVVRPTDGGSLHASS